MGETIGKVPAVSRPVGQSVHPYDYRTLHICNTLGHKKQQQKTTIYIDCRPDKKSDTLYKTAFPFSPMEQKQKAQGVRNVAIIDPQQRAESLI
jgi:hypothetical protein